jgi:hypothetical protein
MPKPKRKKPQPVAPDTSGILPAVEIMETFPMTDPDHPFVVDTVFPRREVHLWGGPSHAGKTTLLFQTIDDWRNGKPVFGYQSYPAPFCYVAADRSHASALETLDRVGIDPATFPLLSMIDEGIKGFENVIPVCQNLVPGLKVIFLDGIARLVGGNMNYYETVAEFLAKTIRELQHHDLTLFGVGHAAKPKEADIIGPRQRFIGSVAWGAMCSTMVIVEPEHSKHVEDINRKVFVMPCNSPSRMFKYKLDLRGRFMLGAAIEEELSETSVPEDFRLQVFDIRERGDIINSAEVNQICEAIGVSDKTGRRYMDKLIREGKIERVGSFGKFKIVRLH